MTNRRAGMGGAEAGSSGAGRRFLVGGGEMGARMRAHDWAASPLGPPEAWPAALKTTVGIVLNSRHPLFLSWGAQALCFCNDAFADSIDENRRRALPGGRGAEHWPEAWPILGPQIEQVMRGEGATWNENHTLPLWRHGRLDTACWTYGCSAVPDDTAPGGIGGVLVVCHETTTPVLTERRQSFLVALDETLLRLADPAQAVAQAAQQLGWQLGVGRVGFGQVMADDQTIVLRTDHAQDQPPLAGRFALDGFGAENARRLRLGETVVWHDLAGLPPAVAAAYGALHVSAFVWVPEISQGRLVGSLFVAAAQPRSWSAHEVQLIEAVAQRIGHVLERQRNEALWQALFRDAAVPMSLTDVEGCFLQVNRAYCEMLGWTEAELLGRSYRDVTHLEEHAGGEAGRLRLLTRAQRSFRTERRYVHRSGRVVWCDLSLSAVDNADGTVAGYVAIVQDISAVREARIELDMTTRRFVFALKNAPVIVFSQDRELRYTWIHDGRLDPARLKQFLGRRDRDFMRPQDATVTEALKLEVLRTGQGRRQQVLVMDRGLERHFDLQVEPLMGADQQPEGVICAAIDVTERLAIEHSLRQERRRLGLALNAAQMGVYENDRELGVLHWSPELYTLFGVEPAHFRPSRESFLAMVHPDDREGCVRAYETGFAPDRPFSHDFRIVRPDGELRWIGNRALPSYGPDGRIQRHVGVAIDLTTVKAAEEALRAADRQKDRFIATLAHELRNPLAPVANAAAVLAGAQGLDGTLRWCVQVIERQVRQMSRLLDDLLDVSRVTLGKVRLEIGAAPLHEVVRLAVDMARPAIEAQRHTLTLDLPDDALMLRADAARIAQVLSNLLVNAAKFTDAGGRIVLGARREGDDAVLRVADSGIGLAEDHLHSIFDLFGQVDDAASRSRGGLGIGLSLVKNIVELHGGRVQAHSAGRGQGSTFELRLPLVGTASAALPERTGTRLPPAAPRRVLVVDDNRDGALSLAALLSQAGYEVDMRHDGLAALEAARASRWDVVLLDLGLPGLDGHEVCREIRRQPGGHDPLIVAVTGWGQDEDRRRTQTAGFDAHLVKPVALERLLALLAGAPGRAGAAATHEPAGRGASASGAPA